MKGYFSNKANQHILKYLGVIELNISYDKDNCIGFRYYENNKLEKRSYFTLIKKYGKKFYILEKEKNDNILDYYSIMRNIAFEKHKNKKIIQKGEYFLKYLDLYILYFI